MADCNILNIHHDEELYPQSEAEPMCSATHKEFGCQELLNAGSEQCM